MNIDGFVRGKVHLEILRNLACVGIGVGVRVKTGRKLITGEPAITAEVVDEGVEYDTANIDIQSFGDKRIVTQEVFDGELSGY